MRRYQELKHMHTFEERFNYLKLNGQVCKDTFGFDRYLNQQFYKSKEWKQIRDFVIVRDNACDLGIEDHEIKGKIYIHHLNPISIYDITNSTNNLLDPENLICVSYETHNAIHYGDGSYLDRYKVEERTTNDTCPWKNA